MNVPDDCPFCRENNLLDAGVVAETPQAYLIPAKGSEGCFLIVPTVHAEQITELPSTWWQEIRALLPRALQGASDYNVSLNVGVAAGQTLKHLHFWVIPRAADGPAHGKGLARLISESNQE
jgi:diadenosine tetraphosphate (Ap4A) HIT family hydrolase